MEEGFLCKCEDLSLSPIICEKIRHGGLYVESQDWEDHVNLLVNQSNQSVSSRLSKRTYRKNLVGQQ